MTKAQKADLSGIIYDSASELSAQNDPSVSAGYETFSSKENGIGVFRVRVSSKKGERALGKPVGSYSTVVLDSPPSRGVTEIGEIAKRIENEIKQIAFSNGITLKNLLVVGVGNREVAADSFGPLCADRIIATRGLENGEKRKNGSVAVISPGVFASTGLTVEEITKCAVNVSGAECVVAIDSLTTRSSERLAATVQITNAGLFPGSASGKNAGELTRDSLGVPVIAIGVPTSLDAYSFLREAAGKEAADGALPFLSRQNRLEVSLKGVDVEIELFSEAVSRALNSRIRNG